jgi:hypothetical protein
MRYILCWLLAQQSLHFYSFLLGAALGPKRWKLSALSLGNIARQEMEKGNDPSSTLFLWITSNQTDEIDFGPLL